MAGINQTESVPKKHYRGSKPLKTPKEQITTIDHVSMIKDELMQYFSKITRKLSNNQCIVLARELQVAFKVVEDFCGVDGPKEKDES